MEIRCLPWGDIEDKTRGIWTRLRASNPALRSPYFAWEFADSVAKFQDNVQVAVLSREDRVLGYLPFQRTHPRRAVPVGSPMNDYQGLVAAPDLEFDPPAVLQACGLDRFDYDHVVVEQQSWAPYHRARVPSPCLDLSRGFDAWMESRRRDGRSGFRRLKELRRALARAAGAVRFELDVRDLRALDRVFALKSAQYRRTLGMQRDLFASPAMAGTLRDLFERRTGDATGTLSVLWAGDRLVAAHFGLRSDTVLHWWFPCYDGELARYSPGALLLLELAESMPKSGIRLLDFGKGTERYKLRWATGSFEVAEGHVDADTLRATELREPPCAAGRTAQAVVLAYHRTADLHPDPFRLCVPPHLFARQLDAIRERYPVLSITSALDAMDAGTHPPRSVAISFDDGYRDAFTAAELLRARRLPATFFVNTEWLSAPRESWETLLEQIVLGTSPLPVRVPIDGIPARL